MRTNPPVFLDLTKIRFPVTAIISIFHRVTGVLLFLFIPFLLYLLGASIASQASFDHVQQLIHMPLMSILIWLILSATSYHLLAGVRHLLMDCGLWEHLKQAQVTAYVTLLLTLVCMVLLGVWLW